MGLRKRFKKLSKKIKKEVRRTPKNISAAPKKIVREVVRTPVNLSRAGAKIVKEAKRTPKNFRKAKEKISNELNRFEDRAGIPARMLWELITRRGGLAKYATTLESYVKQGSKKFSPEGRTWALIEEYKRTVPFPYGRGYQKFFFYYGARTPTVGGAGGGGITFENRIYLTSRPDEDTCAGRKLILHELIHSHQYYKHGIDVFVAKYLRDFFLNLLKGKSINRSYYKIGFEKEAYRIDKQFCEWLKGKGLCANETCD